MFAADRNESHSTADYARIYRSASCNDGEIETRTRSLASALGRSRVSNRARAMLLDSHSLYSRLLAGDFAGRDGGAQAAGGGTVS